MSSNISEPISSICEIYKMEGLDENELAQINERHTPKT